MDFDLLDYPFVSTARRLSRPSEEKPDAAFFCERLHEVFDEFPEPVIIAESNGRILHLNSAARWLSGPDHRLDVRRPSGEPLPRSELPLEQAIRDGHKSTGTEVLIRNREGKDIVYLASAIPIGDMIVALFQETSSLSSLERLRDLWLADVAQALRQPIVASLKCLERIHDSHAGEMQEGERQEMRKIQSTLQGLTRVIADLEQFSRIDARHLELHRRQVDLNSLLRETVRNLSHITQGRPMVTTFRGPTAPISVDPQRIEQVLANLISNAVEYGDPATPIEIEAVFRPGKVEVSVTNQGRGIRMEDIPRVFESRFTRSLKRKEMGLPGLGLGLFVTRGIVEAHGGSIRAVSEPGRRTSFTFTLPLTRL